MKAIYQPRGRAGEYGDYAVNIYTGCNYGCVYCYAAKNAHRWGKDFSDVQPRKGIVEQVKKDCEKLGPGHLIHLCFTCDPWPTGCDTIITREVIKTIKASGNHVQTLTKSANIRDLDLMDGNDWFGVSITCGDEVARSLEPGAAPPPDRGTALKIAHRMGIKTWASFEPVLEPDVVFDAIESSDYIDRYKIGKLNHCRPESLGLPPIGWKTFGLKAERLCKEHGRDYLIKDDLRKEMEN